MTSSRRSLLTAGSMVFAASSATLAAERRPEPPVYGLTAFAPPGTDQGNLGAPTYSFAQARTVQTGAGWIRWVNRRDLPMAQAMAGAQMRLHAGAVQGFHWQAPAEWGMVLNGAVRLFTVDTVGQRADADLMAGDIWCAPSGLPHALQGLGPDGATVVMAFNDGGFGEESSFSLRDWMRHTPKETLARNFGVDPTLFNALPNTDTPIFAAPPPAPLDEQTRQKRLERQGAFHFPLMAVKPIAAAGGAIRIADENNFHASTAMCAALVELAPGGMREMHYHPDADEWQFYLSGRGRMTLFAGQGRANTVDVQGNDVGYAPRLWGHSVENTGSEPLRFLEIFNSGRYADIALKNWLANAPAALMAEHLGVNAAFFQNLPKHKTPIVPA